MNNQLWFLAAALHEHPPPPLKRLIAERQSWAAEPSNMTGTGFEDAMKDYWWRGNWRDNPNIRRSHNPLLRQLAMRQIQYYVNRGDSIETILRLCCGIMGKYGRMDGLKTSTATGHYLIPGSKTDSGVRCSSRQIGALIEYEDGRIEWQVFSLAEIYEDCKHGAKPHQLELI